MDGVSTKGTATKRNISIRIARSSDKGQLANLCVALWPETTADDHAAHLARILDRPSVLKMPVVVMVAETKDRVLVAFLEAGLRSHADGCDDSQPVGYIEGWYVSDDHRKQGIGRKLLDAAENWARSQGCVEMASDALIDKAGSQRAHEALGYLVVDRCVHYRKAL